MAGGCSWRTTTRACARARRWSSSALWRTSRASFAGIELDVDVKLPGYELRVLEALRAKGLVPGR